MGRIFDAINEVVFQAQVMVQGDSEARKFAKEARVGDTWWSVETHAMPWGDTPLAREHRFTKVDKLISGQAMSGHRCAADVWATHGPLFRSPPAGVMTHQEYLDSGSWEFPGAPRRDQVKARETVRKLVAAGR